MDGAWVGGDEGNTNAEKQCDRALPRHKHASTTLFCLDELNHRKRHGADKAAEVSLMDEILSDMIAFSKRYDERVERDEGDDDNFRIHAFAAAKHTGGRETSSTLSQREPLRWTN